MRGKNGEMGASKGGARAERLAAALRDNLHRRKAQARARRDGNLEITSETTDLGPDQAKSPNDAGQDRD